MSVGLSVQAVKEPTEEYAAKVAVWRACEAAGVDIPDEILEYFDHEEPDPTGMTTYLGGECFTNHPCATIFQTEDYYGLEIDLSKLPDGVTRIRAFLA